MRPGLQSLILAFVLATGLATSATAQDPTVDKPDPSITSGSAQKQLDAAKARWKAAHSPKNYTWTISTSCFCPTEITKPFKVKVSKGHAVKPADHLTQVATVEKAFKQVQSAITSKVAGLSVAYAPNGRPTHIGIDRSRMIADEEVGWTFAKFVKR